MLPMLAASVAAAAAAAVVTPCACEWEEHSPISLNLTWL